MARPKSDKRIVRLSVTLDSEDHEKLAKLAADLDLSTAWLVRRAVTEFVTRHGNEENFDLPLTRPDPAGTKN